MTSHLPRQPIICAVLLTSGGLAMAVNKAPATPAALRESLTFYASFDQAPEADFARGDRKVYTAEERGKRDAATPGLPAPELARLAAGEGKFGGALEFRKMMKPQVFFRGGDNIGYKPKHWNGSLSFWLRLDPDKDLEPGYCDPVQLVAQSWNEGNMFVEFSKDHTPRHFRFAMMAVTKFWNPNNRKWEEISEAARPMVAVHQPPFRRDRWTHVLVTFANINSGAADGRGTLYLDGRKQGTFSGWNNTFNWDVSKSALTLGLSYVGFLDDLAVFNRELTESEARAVYSLSKGIAELR
ncbi:MAG: LamG-like jellyroll fold domain-containing protein [Opitutaceae bacterium]